MIIVIVKNLGQTFVLKRQTEILKHYAVVFCFRVFKKVDFYVITERYSRYIFSGKKGRNTTLKYVA